MGEAVTYYAIVNEFSTRERPFGIVRRVKHEGGRRDEVFSRDLKWEHTALLYSAERGDLTNDSASADICTSSLIAIDNLETRTRTAGFEVP